MKTQYVIDTKDFEAFDAAACFLRECIKARVFDNERTQEEAMHILHGLMGVIPVPMKPTLSSPPEMQ